MKTASLLFLSVILSVSLIPERAFSWTGENGMIIDHTCTDLSLIPPQFITGVKDSIKLHYAHTSHGAQITTGLIRIRSADYTYDVEILQNALPQDDKAFCVFDGQTVENYVPPRQYWQTDYGMDDTRAVLTSNPELNISMFCWCTELETYTQEQVQEYLDSIMVLESEFGDVTFIYMTGNAQHTGEEGYNRYLRNEQIRQHCRDHDRVLYDFADLDCWWFNPSTEEWEHSTYLHGEIEVPVEHPQFFGEESGHTTYESCEQKGKACWWMTSMIGGWADDPSGTRHATWGDLKRGR